MSGIIGLDKVGRAARPPAYNRAHVLPGQKADGMTPPSPTADQERLIEELRAAIAARDEFIAIAAHELRNPMTPIVGQVQLLLSRARREQASPALLQGLETLEVAVDHYVRRATTLLEITRLNAEHVRLEPTSFDLSDLARACVRKYEQLAMRAGSALDCDVAGSVEGTWDHLATEQVLDNLVSNAIRYGDGKPVRVELDGQPEWVELRVIDHGIGIAPADRERIFQRFERASGAPRSGGFGIGLWLSSRLVQAQGGTLALHSEPGQGSTFIVRLPRDVTAQAKIE
jgi:signal transduction histidine kinase